MRSLITIEVEHESTDSLDKILNHVVERYGEDVITDYTVRVDLPESFVLNGE